MKDAEMASGLSLTIVVPAYNEEGSIARTIRELHPLAETAGATLLVVFNALRLLAPQRVDVPGA